MRLLFFVSSSIDNTKKPPAFTRRKVWFNSFDAMQIRQADE